MTLMPYLRALSSRQRITRLGHNLEHAREEGEEHVKGGAKGGAGGAGESSNKGASSRPRSAALKEVAHRGEEVVGEQRGGLFKHRGDGVGTHVAEAEAATPENQEEPRLTTSPGVNNASHVLLRRGYDTAQLHQKHVDSGASEEVVNGPGPNQGSIDAFGFADDEDEERARLE